MSSEWLDLKDEFLPFTHVGEGSGHRLFFTVQRTVADHNIDLAVAYKLTPKSWDSYARLNVTPPLGPKKTEGAACYPGELGVTFYPRAVMKDAAAYLQALRSLP